MPVSKLFQLYRGGEHQAFYQCFPVILVTSTLTIFFPSHWLLSHLFEHCRKNGQRERKMNPVTMPVINPRKEYCPNRGSNKPPLVLKSSTLPTVQGATIQRDEIVIIESVHNASSS